MRNRLFTVALALVMVAILLAAVPTGQASATGGGVHCVKYGETLYGIARYYGTSVYAIAHANGIWNPNYLRAGVCLRIPAGYGYPGGGYGVGYGHKPGYGKPAYWPTYPKGGYGHGMGYGKPGYYGKGHVHCVKYGETLSGIAYMYRTTAWAIARANGLWSPNYIRAGQCLVIPGYGY